MVASDGTAQYSGASRRAPSAARTAWGALHGPLGDRGHGPGAGQHRGGGQGQDRHQRMSPPAEGSGVRDGGQVVQQVPDLGVAERVVVGELGHGGWDRG
ncbi:MAG: hypothetical protein K0S88_605 [Actinomycetia bacterium]|jgi:hypothetical protein|nr:hypothetical protein [Actinomycetes bacterium]